MEKERTTFAKRERGVGMKRKTDQKKSALVYCEKEFGLMDGKTAAALVRHSEIYTVVGVIDSSLPGKDAGEELGGEKCGVPIFANLDDALSKLSEVPNCYIYGKDEDERSTTSSSSGSGARSSTRRSTCTPTVASTRHEPASAATCASTTRSVPTWRWATRRRQPSTRAYGQQHDRRPGNARGGTLA